MNTVSGNILVVDDHSTNRLKMSLAAKNLGYTVDTAINGIDALEKIRTLEFDLVLLDILMPEMDGYEVLSIMKGDAGLNSIPVIVISAVEELDSVIKAIELGAEDYLPKSFDPVLLKARVNASLEKKRLRDKTEQQLAITKELFGKFVPERIAESILQGQGHIEPVNTTATILFTDIQGFTSISEGLEPAHVAEMLNAYFPAMIEPINEFGGVLNQFLGDAMMVVYNIPVNDPQHADSAVKTALAIREISETQTFSGKKLKTRVGICTGEVFAGNIGSGDRIHYTIHGDSVNVAARLEQLNKTHDTNILMAESTVQHLKGQYALNSIGEIDIRGRSSMQTYSVQ